MNKDKRPTSYTEYAEPQSERNAKRRSVVMSGLGVAGLAAVAGVALFGVDRSEPAPESTPGISSTLAPNDPVCDLEDLKIVTLKKDEYNANPEKYTTDLKFCLPPRVLVCALDGVNEGKIVEIEEDRLKAHPENYSRNRQDCPPIDFGQTTVPQPDAPTISLAPSTPTN